ncbi:hypothetical protein CR513_01622, partial [Mucuna pruriens]
MAKAIYQRGPWSVSMASCQHGELVSTISADGGRQFFYLYDTLHSKLGVKLPFTHFEQVVLHAMNVAPTQLHPNSWAFVRAFELLCKDLSKAPTLGFFYLRKTDKVGWTSLSNRARHKLLKPFLESYKTFKNRFFQVALSDSGSNLLVNRFGRPFFPLHWTQQPVVSILVDRKDLEGWKDAFITELEELPLLSRAEIIKGTGYSTHALKELRKRKELLASQSSHPNVVVVPLSTAGPQDNPQMFEEGTSHTPSLVVLDWLAAPSSPLPEQDSGQDVQTDSAERPNKRPHLQEVVIEEAEDQAAGRRDSNMMDQLIDPTAFTFAIDQALASSSLGRESQTWADKVKKSEEDVLRWSTAYSEAKSEWLQAKSDLEQEKDSHRSELDILRQDFGNLEVTQKNLEEKLMSAEASITQAQDTILTCDQTIFQQGIDIVDQYEVGFGRALEQVQLLHPSLDVSETRSFKEIVDGKLVSVETPPGSLAS